MSGTRTISTTSRREQSSSFFFLQDKAPKEIHAILTETLACFLPGRTKDLSASLYWCNKLDGAWITSYNQVKYEHFVSKLYSLHSELVLSVKVINVKD